MNSNLLFEFTTDKENKTIYVTRQFDANLDLVWKAWTTAELLDQWWAPKPYQTVTKSMDFTEGGTWLYHMRGPENDIHWCKLTYEKISPLKWFTGTDAFCDENGNANTILPGSHWKNAFSEEDDSTIVNITITFESLLALEKTIEMGFREGFTMGLQNLDELLATMTK